MNISLDPDADALLLVLASHLDKIMSFTQHPSVRVGGERKKKRKPLLCNERVMMSSEYKAPCLSSGWR